ncbi:MAG: carotenoid biosynthesis protein [Promethearchaeota archaeon]
MKIIINLKRTEVLLIIILIMYLVSAEIYPFIGFYNLGIIGVIMGFIPLIFIIIHGVLRYGGKNMIIFFIITFIISWTTETLSILTGFPFGNYYYTDVLGPKLWLVPLLIMPAYFMTGYLAWTISSTFLGSFGKGIEKKNLFIIPFIAGFIMTMWDFCFDPIRANVDHAWVWEDGGNYWGVPISNYFGWYLTVYLIYQVYALYLYKFQENEEIGEKKLFWVLPTIAYLGLSLEFLIEPFFQTVNLDIYWSMFLTSIFTMVFTAVLNLIIVQKTKIN